MRVSPYLAAAYSSQTTSGRILLGLQVLKDEKTVCQKITHVYHLAFAG